MSYLKITAVVILLVFILWSAFYIWVVDSIGTLVNESNQGFIAFMPTEAKAVVAILVFSILVSLAYAFFRE